jgi:succinate-semialdehyde dehydrogenase/glutarate-semialdehyde dehydrogenase
MKVGPGWSDTTAVGPIINKTQLDRIAVLVDDAQEHGARVLTGGARVAAPGWFYEPTVIDDIPSGCRILDEEIFGPVAAIRGFDTEEEGIALANSTQYGLASYFYATDLARVQRVARALEAGMVGVNRGIVSDPAAPFGGIKQSGIGLEGGSEGISEYLNTKYIALPPSR